MTTLDAFEQAAQEVTGLMRYSHRYPFDFYKTFIELNHLSLSETKLRIYDIDRIRHADFLRAFKRLRDAWEAFYKDMINSSCSDTFIKRYTDIYENLVNKCIDKIMYYQDLLEKE